MCYDVSFTVSIKQLSDYFPDLVFDDQLEMDFNMEHNFTHIAGHAYGKHPIIYVHREDTAPHCRLMEWGVITHYTKDEEAYKRYRATMLNIRSERILDDPKSYWYKIRQKRCLIPVTGFYEHREVDGLKKKVPYFIRLKGQPIMFIPGLYSVVELPDKITGEMIKRHTYAMITREAVTNDVMKQIHNGGVDENRMPLLLPFELSKRWIQKELQEGEYREILKYEMPSEALLYHSVYTIRSPKGRPDEKEKNEYYQWEGVPEIVI